MNRKIIDSMSISTFYKMPVDKQIEFIEVCKADYDVVADLIRDRNLFRDYYKKLRQQLLENDIIPRV